MWLLPVLSLMLLLLLLLLLLPSSHASTSTVIQRGMGAIFERNQTTAATALRAIICPADHYGVVGVNGTDSVWKKYGRVATPCTQCPTNMVTRGSSADLKVATIQVVNATDDQQTQGLTTASSEGYYTVDSCFTQPGYGERSATA